MSDQLSDRGVHDEPIDWDAVARYLTDESPAEEAARLRHWLEARPARAEMVAALDRSVSRLALEPPADLDVEGALRRVRARLDDADVIPLPTRVPAPARPAPWWRSAPLRAAAVVAVLLGGGLLARELRPVATEQAVAVAPRTYSTAFGERESVTLADGSVVLLGPGSELTVAAGYGEGIRAVELRGEALFEVVHDETRPFSVRAGGAEIRDLGTTFVVNTDPGDGVRVAVTAGSVSLAPAGAPASAGTLLRPGDRALLEGGRAVVEHPAALESDLAWTRGRLVFEEAPLSEVAVELWRWYGTTLRVESPSLRGRELTASFEDDEPVERVLDVVRLAVGASLEMRGDTAILRAAGRSGAR